MRRGPFGATALTCQSGPTWKVIDLVVTTRLMGIAFEMALVVLQHTDGIVNPTRDAGQKIIELAEAGERNPGRLCDAALQALRPVIVRIPILFRMIARGVAIESASSPSLPPRVLIWLCVQTPDDRPALAANDV